jgi:hypothetical protein
MNEHLGITIDPLIKLLISLDCIINANLMRHDKRRLGFASDLRIVSLLYTCDCAYSRSSLSSIDCKPSHCIDRCPEKGLSQRVCRRISESDLALTVHLERQDRTAHTTLVFLVRLCLL